MNEMTKRSPNPLTLLMILLAAVLYACPLPAGAVTNPSPPPGFGPSGLPLPRFVSLGPSKVYVRTGPGRQYPIDWVYVRRGLPVEVIAEYDIWRRIKDHDGSTGWIHGSMLSGRRTVTIHGGTQTLYHEPDLKSWPVLRAEENVIAELKRCKPDWCEIQIEGKSGWIPISGIWGTNAADIKK